MTGNQYKFSGKELDEEGGLDWYYFGARYFDPNIGRWLGVDPLAGKYPGFSPYNYVANNPLKFIDPDGKDIKVTQFAKKNANFNKSMSLFMKTKLGSDKYKSLDNNKSVLVIITVKENMVGLNGVTQFESRQNRKYIVSGESFPNTDNKKVIVVTVDPTELDKLGVVESSETIYHELEAHVSDYEQDPVILDSSKDDHKDYSRTSSDEEPRKGSKAEQYLNEAKKVEEDEKNKK